MEKKFSLGQKLNSGPKLPGGVGHDIHALPNQAATRHDTLAKMKAKVSGNVGTFNAMAAQAAAKTPELQAGHAKLQQKNLEGKFDQIKSVD